MVTASAISAGSVSTIPVRERRGLILRQREPANEMSYSENEGRGASWRGQIGVPARNMPMLPATGTFG